MKYSFLCLAFLSIAVLLLGGCQEEKREALSVYDLEIISGKDVFHHFAIEIAVTPQEQSKGLMYRTEMDDDAGMLFYFNEEAERGFWMKNTLIPLDMLFIKADGTIHHIHESAIPHDLTSIRSNGAVRAVLEINGGLSHKLGLRVGDKIKHQFFSANSVQ